MIKTIFKRVAAALLVCGVVASGALIVPRADAQFAGQATFGSEATGAAANAQVITLANVSSVLNLKGVTISFVVGAGLTNTGPTTLVVNSLAPVNIERRNSGTLMALGGGEMPASYMVRMTYDGTEFVLDSDYTGGDPVGSAKIINYASADPGYALEAAGCLSKTGEPSLYAKIGDTYTSADSCASGNFGLPDMKGRVPAGMDNMGGVAANRLTSAISGIAATAIGAAGGTQGYGSGISQSYLQNFSLPASTSVTYDGVQASAINVNETVQSNAQTGNGPSQLWLSYQFGGVIATTNVTSGGSGTAFSTTPPEQIVAYEIKL